MILKINIRLHGSVILKWINCKGLCEIINLGPDFYYLLISCAIVARGYTLAQ